MEIKTGPMIAPLHRPQVATQAAPIARVDAPPLSSDLVSLGSTAPAQLRWDPGSTLVNPRAEDLAQSVEKTWNQTACSSVAELASRYFSTDEFQALNSGTYHNFEHPLVVADAAGGFANGLGWPPERKQFMQQVALLHDADDRSQLNSEDVKTGTPARAQVTLEWMDQQKDLLCDRFGWDKGQFAEAKALIARTDFPFDDKAKKPMGTRYDGQSAMQVYRELLQELPKDRQAQVLQDGLALRFADQAGFYAGSFDMAVDAVKGLTSELQGVGVPTDLLASLKFTPGFLGKVGDDNQLDKQLAQELGHNLDLPGRDRLLSLWDPAQAQRFRTNSEQFDLLGQALQSVQLKDLQDLDSQLPTLKDTARACYRMATGRTPT